ncbi:MAG: hypothetical protein JO117_09210 [Verrucomicrobia bacterium]|nr:hypothetical protein [Verrucomicrobiota bacterium]MBV9658388.1 hypothetical protein [Verrucomicrobiota bacterium]
MKSSDRLMFLKIGAAAVVGLFLLDKIVLSPAIASWNDQSERIDALRKKVERGRQLVQREDAIRQRWAEMLHANLPADMSAAESDAFKALSRWVRDSGVALTSLTPQWQTHEEGYESFECRAAATGDQVSLGRFIYELEVDPMPVSLEECEITTRDARGAQLNMTARFSFVRLTTEGGRSSRR